MHLHVGCRVLRESQQGQRQTTGQREQWCKRRQGADGTERNLAGEAPGSEVA